jgi:hypothetical protein
VASFPLIPKAIESEVSFCTTLAILFYFRTELPPSIRFTTLSTLCRPLQWRRTHS